LQLACRHPLAGGRVAYLGLLALDLRRCAAPCDAGLHDHGSAMTQARHGKLVRTLTAREELGATLDTWPRPVRSAAVAQPLGIEIALPDLRVAWSFETLARRYGRGRLRRCCRRTPAGPAPKRRARHSTASAGGQKPTR
jgi:hypothetical protein